MRVWGTSAADLNDAAAAMHAGGPVAFPTETVYGLGANALDATAVAAVFAAKGRPPTNPVIVHVAEVEHAGRVAVWSATAAKLAATFWPGPLTLVLPKRNVVPDIVTAGGPTVGVRCPAHTVARAFIRATGVPVAAPSANRSTELSPTRAEHVVAGLAGRIAGVIDGGPCPGGIESTVLDLSGSVPRLLRPGLVSRAEVEAILGPVAVGSEGGVAKSPGLMAKHYSPRTPVELFETTTEVIDEVQRRLAAGQRVKGLIHSTYLIDAWLPAYVDMPDDPEQYAAVLYDRLHQLDAEGLDAILIAAPGDSDEPGAWAAVRDRLRRATG